MLPSAQFVAGFVPPDYTIDGLLQRRFLYSFTGPTGHGKTSIVLRLAAHKAEGWTLTGREMDAGAVLFFAGENPNDVRMRWIKMCEEMNLDPDTVDVYFLDGTPDIGGNEFRKRINAEVAAIGRLISLLIVDTSAAYYTGDDENDRVQMRKHAQMLRTFTTLAGGPTVLVTCHPIKNYNPDYLVPAGGGSFLNEVDGNLVCLREPGNMIAEVHWHGKFRGSDFAPIAFKLKAGTSDKLKDTKGRLLWTVTATPVGDEEKIMEEETLRENENKVLSLLNAMPELASLSIMAVELGWFYSDGKTPDKTKVHRELRALEKFGLVKKVHDGWQLTKAGKAAAKPWRPQPQQAAMEF